ncbi:uncharacterized protein CDAR_599121 [Caerostris darwini]|uniref:Spidroin C-terminal domain-containing protein n=1 Tax=Caerostris darwini TaxID=1538125 RepID=A0AAV4R4F6_9ARAC|nr:uncharacterized protein CDAR_599121 [Caerostris darwini]
MNSLITRILFLALLSLILESVASGIEINRISSPVSEVQTLMQTSDEFLRCFAVQSYEKLPSTGQAYADSLSREIRSFSPQSKDSVTKEETFVFITKLASFISDSVASDLQQKNDFATVLQLISDCFCDLAGYQPFKLIQSIASLMRLLLDEESTENWNTFFENVQVVLPEEFRTFENEVKLLGPQNYSTTLLLPVEREKALSRRTRQAIPNAPEQYRLSTGISSSSLPSTMQQIKDNNNKLQPRERYQILINDIDSIESEFSSIFTDTIASSDYLSKVYDTSVHPIITSKSYYKAVYDVAFTIPTLNPVTVARIVSEAVKATFNKLTTSQHIMAYGNVAGKYLKSQGLLSAENIPTLCQLYVEFLELAVSSVRAGSAREASITAIFYGFVNFVSYLDDFIPETILILATDLANNFYSLSGIKRNIFYSDSSSCEVVTASDNFGLKSNRWKSLMGSINELGNGNYENCAKLSVVSLFTFAFQETVSLSKTLSAAFEKKISGTLLSAMLFAITRNHFLKLGSSGTSSMNAANIISRAVNVSYSGMTPVIIIDSLSSAVGLKLMDEKLLSLKNHQQLSDSFIEFLEMAMESLDKDCSAGSCIRSILTGTGNFLSSQGISLAGNAELLATYFVKALNSTIKDFFTDEEFRSTMFWGDFATDYFPNNIYSLELFGSNFFTGYILDEIFSSSHLSKLFDIPPEPETAMDVFYKIFRDITLNSGMENSHQVADLISHEIAKASGNLRRSTFANIFIKSIEKFLRAKSILTSDNTLLIARAYVKALHKTSKKVSSNEPQYSNLYVLINTTYHFLATLLIFGTEGSRTWSTIFLSELVPHPTVTLTRLINEVAPEALSPNGLSSSESLERIYNLAYSVASNIIFSKEVGGGMNIDSFVQDLTIAFSQLIQDYPALNPQTAFIQSLLEGIVALMSVINGSYITALDLWSSKSEIIDMIEAFSNLLQGKYYNRFAL